MTIDDIEYIVSSLRGKFGKNLGSTPPYILTFLALT